MLFSKVTTTPCNKSARQCGDCKRAFSSNTPRNVRLAAAGEDVAGRSDAPSASTRCFVSGRRHALAALVTVPAVLQANAALAVQGLTAGRIPGISTTADADGFYTYTRPEVSYCSFVCTALGHIATVSSQEYAATCPAC
eukprot:GHRQ01013854.1.p1 GENE.GHRQ01013854.1~~GHRQ01013854.1.p1  ORF type:complete len:139 (+),score=22.96 GHRQ01013854.1:232-648(+)